MSKHSIFAVTARRRFLALAAALAAGGIAGACGVKGPLYLPEESQQEQEKDEDEENVSERVIAPHRRRHA